MELFVVGYVFFLCLFVVLAIVLIRPRKGEQERNLFSAVYIHIYVCR